MPGRSSRRSGESSSRNRNGAHKRQRVDERSGGGGDETEYESDTNIRRKIDQLEDKVTELSGKMSKQQGQLEQHGDKIEALERHSRSINRRIFNVPKGINPKDKNKIYEDIILKLFVEGFKLPESEARAIALSNYHYVGQGACVIVRFVSVLDIDKLLELRKNLTDFKFPGCQYPVSFSTDLTGSQQAVKKKAREVLLALKKKPAYSTARLVGYDRIALNNDVRPAEEWRREL